MKTTSVKAISLLVLLLSYFSTAAEEIKSAAMHGKIESEQNPKEITLDTVKNGETVLHSTAFKVSDDLQDLRHS